MQSEYKEKQLDVKGELQSDIQFSEQRIFLHTTSYNFLAEWIINYLDE